jgi:hypothetical protein
MCECNVGVCDIILTKYIVWLLVTDTQNKTHVERMSYDTIQKITVLSNQRKTFRKCWGTP